VKIGSVIPLNTKKKMKKIALDAEAKKITRLIRRRRERHMKKIIAIYDNGGKTVDRYTVVLRTSQRFPHEYACLGLSDNPDSPQSFSQLVSCVPGGDHFGKKIRFEDLPVNVQKHVKKRLE